MSERQNRFQIVKRRLSAVVAAALLAAVTCCLPSSNVAEEKDAADHRPSVYTVENTGEDFPRPVLPAIENLPVTKPLTDPFLWSDGNGRVANFDE